jgi:dienelactone hydrolase
MPAPRFELRSLRPLVDEPVPARLFGLPPGDHATITATCTDADGIAFTSWAEYVAGDDGSIDPATHPPLQGTYQGTDPFGLWWSMTADPLTTFAEGLDPVPTTLRAHHNGAEVASIHLERHRIAPGVTATPVREHGLVATFLAPAGRRSPPVMVLGGSGGGLHWSETTAALLASRGFAALGVAYFDMPGLPQWLTGIPLEYLQQAMAWLLRQDQVDSERVALMGASRGAELALLLGATFPETVGGVVAYVPSAVAWGMANPSTGRVFAAWTHEARQVPSLVAVPATTMADGFSAALDDTEAADKAAIAVERIPGPLLMVSGGDDAIWPSERLATMVMTRRDRQDDRHLTYPLAGHSAGRPAGLPASEGFAYHPILQTNIAMGGSKAANGASATDAWPQVLNHLRRGATAP